LVPRSGLVTDHERRCPSSQRSDASYGVPTIARRASVFFVTLPFAADAAQLPPKAVRLRNREAAIRGGTATCAVFSFWPSSATSQPFLLLRRALSFAS